MRRASGPRSSEVWQNEDYDVFDQTVRVGRIYRKATNPENWLWVVDWYAAGHKPVYGIVSTRDAAMDAFRAAWDDLERERN